MQNLSNYILITPPFEISTSWTLNRILGVVLPIPWNPCINLTVVSIIHYMGDCVFTLV